MDVVYPYKRVEDEFALRYSLRSLAHMPHDRVIVGGDKPRIVGSNVLWAGAIPNADRYKSSTTNIVEAIRQCEIVGEFVVMNDDMFLLRSWSFRHEHRGTIDEYLATGRAAGGYHARIVSTRAILKAHGVDEPMWFGLHTPTVYDSAKLADLVKEHRGKSYLLRTLYHNLFPAPAERREDVKVREWTGDVPADDVLSISDSCAFDPAFRAWLEARFPEQSPYELPAEREAA